jgi:hypothetical protein
VSSRFVRALVILATIAGFYGVLAPTNAIADPSRNAGCRSAQSTQRWGKLGIVAYGQTRSFRYCWTGGLVMNSKVYAISGDANCWSNGPEQSTDRFVAEVQPRLRQYLLLVPEPRLRDRVTQLRLRAVDLARVAVHPDAGRKLGPCRQ